METKREITNPKHKLTKTRNTLIKTENLLRDSDSDLKKYMKLHQNKCFESNHYKKTIKKVSEMLQGEETKGEIYNFIQEQSIKILDDRVDNLIGKIEDEKKLDKDTECSQKVELTEFQQGIYNCFEHVITELRFIREYMGDMRR